MSWMTRIPRMRNLTKMSCSVAEVRYYLASAKRVFEALLDCWRWDSLSAAGRPERALKAA